MSYLLLNADNTGFDDGEGNEVSLGEHLDYVNDFGGSPDCWGSVEADNRNTAMREARESGLHLYVVDENFPLGNGESYCRVVGIVNQPDENKDEHEG